MSLEQCKEIYKTYPRRVAPNDAYRAIEKALQRLVKGEDTDERLTLEDAYIFLLARTVLYAKAREGCEKKFTPHPATWFNRGSYLEDESEWSNGNGHNENAAAIERVVKSLYEPDDENLGGSLFKFPSQR